MKENCDICKKKLNLTKKDNGIVTFTGMLPNVKLLPQQQCKYKNRGAFYLFFQLASSQTYYDFQKSAIRHQFVLTGLLRGWL